MCKSDIRSDLKIGPTELPKSGCEYYNLTTFLTIEDQIHPAQLIVHVLPQLHQAIKVTEQRTNNNF